MAVELEWLALSVLDREKGLQLQPLSVGLTLTQLQPCLVSAQALALRLSPRG